MLSFKLRILEFIPQIFILYTYFIIKTRLFLQSYYSTQYYDGFLLSLFTAHNDFNFPFPRRTILFGERII